MPANSDISWKRAVGLASLVIYGPYIVMAICAVLFVSCTHCKRTACLLLPSGPGMIPLEFARSVLNFSRFTDWAWFVVAFLISLSLVTALAGFIRLGETPRNTGLALALVAFSISAYCLLSMIRS